MENKVFRKFGFCLLLLIIGGVGFFVEAAAYNIDFEGRWGDIQRSVFPGLPVSASVDGNILIIQSSSTSVDITVVVSHDGVPVYEKIILASQTSQIVIDMNGWEKGEYMLELRNKWGGYLYGGIRDENVSVY